MNYINEVPLEDEKPSKWNRFFIFFIGIFLIILILSYFLISYPLFPILESLFESRISQDNKIILDNFSIIFKNDTYRELQELYYSNQSTEIAVCLIGEKKIDYFIYSLYSPETIEQSFDHVRFKSCTDDTLIILHSHPFRKCIASEQDLKMLNETKQSNNQSIIIIMCEPNRFSIYS
nr:hypothetical protein [Nanoarchaeum sp.]